MTVHSQNTGRLTDAERAVLPAATYYAKVHELASPPEAAYFEVLPDARLGILHRVVGNLLREPLDGLPPQVVTRPAEEAVPTGRLPFPDGVDSVLDRLRPLPDDCRHLAFLPFPDTETVLAVPLAAVHGFDRFRPTGPPTAFESDAARSVRHPLDVVALLEREGCVDDPGECERFERELDESAANLALAYLGKRVLSRRLSGGADPLESIPQGLGGADRLAALERLPAIEERPTNPSAKIRRGMSATDSLVYSPEFTDSVEVRFVAVRRDYAVESRSETSAGMTEYLCTLFDGLETALDQSLPNARAPEEYVVVPVHPWQFHNVLRDRTDRLRADERVIPVSDFTRSASPLLNLRTVVPRAGDRISGDTEDGENSEEHFPHLKLSIGVQKTSSVRTIPPVEVYDGPLLTDLFRRIEARESFDSLGFLGEPVAARFDAPAGDSVAGGGSSNETDDAPLDRHLSAIVRENPFQHRLLDDGADPVTAASLLADVPGLERPLVCEVIDQFAESRDTTDPADATYAFLDSYLETFVGEQLRLLTKYGIALDMHLQNACVAFDEDYRPTASLFRDFGGVRICTNRLRSHGLGVELHPESPVEASERAAYKNVVVSTLQLHVGELIGTLAHHGAVEEEECWNRVRRRYRDALESIRADGEVPDAWTDRDADVLFGDSAFHTSRIEMRLHGAARSDATTTVSNPLADGGRSSVAPSDDDEAAERANTDDGAGN